MVNKVVTAALLFCACHSNSEHTAHIEGQPTATKPAPIEDTLVGDWNTGGHLRIADADERTYPVSEDLIDPRLDHIEFRDSPGPGGGTPIPWYYLTKKGQRKYDSARALTH
jgi:protein involved in temperature-dependent protein secretion